MIPLFKEVATLDKKCYDRFFLSEDLLMEHAAIGLKDVIPKDADRILIVSGTGNNGADGIALARLISDKDVELYLPFGVKSEMAKLQIERAQAVGVRIVNDIEDRYDLVVDAIFGSGLNRRLNDNTIEIIEKINSFGGKKIACDIPTGIDLNGDIKDTAFKADVTVTMGAYKEALYSDKAKDFTGKIVRANLGVADSVYEDKADAYLLEKEDMNLPLRDKKNCHKGDFGHLCVVGGKMPGAAIIAAKSALNFGVGKVTIVENEPYTIPYELMSSSSVPVKVDAICIGMGLGNQYDDEYLSSFLFSKDVPMLIDADLFYEDIVLKVIKEQKNVVLTPHPREFVNLLNICDIANIDIETLQSDRLLYVREFSKKFPKVTLYLKGANSIIAYDEKIYIQPFGTNVLSKGGSGDVLGGMIASLLAQGYSPLQAAISGSIAHSFAGRSYEKNNYSLTPSDLIDGIKRL